MHRGSVLRLRRRAAAATLGTSGGLLWVALAALAVPAPARAEALASDVPGPRLAPADAALRDRIAAQLAAHGVPAAGVALVSLEGGVRAFGVGTADPATGRPADADTLFRAASLSKGFTAVALMRLVEQGRLSLSARLRDVAPEVSFENPWEETQPVLVAHLLEHTTGWEFEHFVEDVDEDGPSPLAEILRRSPGSRRSWWPPGTYPRYSNEGYLVAGYLLEKLTGEPYDDAIRRLVLGPLGMDDAAFRLEPRLLPRLAVGTIHGRPVRLLEDGMRPASGLDASPRAMARWLAYWVGRGAGTPLLSPASLARIEESRTRLGPGPDLAYGLGNDAKDWRGVPMRGHFGETDGFVSGFAYAPREGFGWIVMLSSEDPEALHAVEETVAEALDPGHAPLPPAAPAARLPPAELAGLAGWYTLLTPGRAVWAPLTVLSGQEVRVRDGALERRQFAPDGPLDLFRAGPWEPLQELGDGRFADPGASLARFRFVRRGGEVLLLEELAASRRVEARTALLVRLGIAAAALLLATAAVLAPIAAARALRQRRRPPWALLLGGACGAVAALAFLLARHTSRLGRPGPVAETLWALSWLFPVLAAALCAAAAIDLVREARWSRKLYHLLLAASGGGLAACLWQAGWIGLRTWRS